jgi:hypothetical protein
MMGSSPIKFSTEWFLASSSNSEWFGASFGYDVSRTYGTKHGQSAHVYPLRPNHICHRFLRRTLLAKFPDHIGYRLLTLPVRDRAKLKHLLGAQRRVTHAAKTTSRTCSFWY